MSSFTQVSLLGICFTALKKSIFVTSQVSKTLTRSRELTIFTTALLNFSLYDTDYTLVIMKNEHLWGVDIEFKILMRKVKSPLKQTTPSKFAVPHSLIHRSRSQSCLHSILLQRMR